MTYAHCLRAHTPRDLFVRRRNPADLPATP